jgi:hypothetical protein
MRGVDGRPQELTIGFQKNPYLVGHIDPIAQHAVHEHIGQLGEMFRVCVDCGRVWKRGETLRLKIVSYDLRWRNFGLTRYRKALFTWSDGSSGGRRGRRLTREPVSNGEGRGNGSPIFTSDES